MPGSLCLLYQIRANWVNELERGLQCIIRLLTLGSFGKGAVSEAD